MTPIDLLIHRAPTRSTRSERLGGATAADTVALSLAEGAHLLDLDLAGQRCTLAQDGENAAYLLRDVAAALVPVFEGRAAKAQVVAHDTPWELCFVPGDAAILVSVFRGGPVPEVRALDRAVEPTALLAALRRAADALPFPADGLDALLDRLDAASPHHLVAPARGPSMMLQWASRAGDLGDDALSVTFNALSPGETAARRESTQSDLHALLVQGRIGISLRGRGVELAPGFVALQFERLVALCRPLLEAWAARRPLHLRMQVSDLSLGIRLSTDERLALTLTRNPGGSVTLPALAPAAFVAPVLDGALALAAALSRCDRSLARNLRLRALRNEARALRRWLRNLGRNDRRTNPDPTLYQVPVEAPVTSDALDLRDATRLRYSVRWRAEIEGLDLAGTLLCGDRLIVPGARELHALDRMTGAAVWSVPVPRASTTLAGDALLRQSPRGEVELRAASSGEVLWSTRITPRVGTLCLPHAVTAPGLPRLVVVAEGERRLVALDLRTGEPRWSFTARHAGTFRMKRAGRLLVVVSGDATVTALDLASGEVVWRFGDRVPFHTTPLLHRDQLFAVAGEATRGSARLYALDAYAGEPLWSCAIDASVCAPACVTKDTVAVPVASREGFSLEGRSAADGTVLWTTSLSAVQGSSSRPSVTAFDDLFVANLPTGRVLAVDAADGSTRWSRTLRAPLGDDLPRRLDAQLRAGALFIPQSALAVLRPRDGAVLAEVDACDLVPDLVRVDEQCAIYVAEESGHLGCYEPGARLRVIRAV